MEELAPRLEGSGQPGTGVPHKCAQPPAQGKDGRAAPPVILEACQATHGSGKGPVPSTGHTQRVPMATTMLGQQPRGHPGPSNWGRHCNLPCPQILHRQTPAEQERATHPPRSNPADTLWSTSPRCWQLQSPSGLPRPPPTHPHTRDLGLQRHRIKGSWQLSRATTDKTQPTILGPRGAHLPFLPRQASDQPQPPTHPTPTKAAPSRNQTKPKEEKGTTVCFPFC